MMRNAKKFTDLSLIVKNNNVARIPAHILLGHFIFEQVEKIMKLKT